MKICFNYALSLFIYCFMSSVVWLSTTERSRCRHFMSQSFQLLETDYFIYHSTDRTAHITVTAFVTPVMEYWLDWFSKYKCMPIRSDLSAFGTLLKIMSLFVFCSFVYFVEFLFPLLFFLGGGGYDGLVGELHTHIH